jgi:hypothetical protein
MPSRFCLTSDCIFNSGAPFERHLSLIAHRISAHYAQPRRKQSKPY